MTAQKRRKPTADHERDRELGLDLEARSLLREEVREFYHWEADLLDDQELHAWRDDVVTEDIDYRMPVRTTREREAEGSEFSEMANIFKEDHMSIDARVRRFDNEYAWSENPPTRNRRYVTNVRLLDVDGDGGEDGDELRVKNNILVYRAKEDEVDGDIIAGERFDTLRRVDGDLRLAEREVRLDHTVLNKRPLSIFL